MISPSIIIKEMFTQKIRIILTIVAIAWGTASITTMLAIGEGLKRSFDKAMSSVGRNLVIISGGQTTQNFGGIFQGKNTYFNRHDRDVLLNNFPELQALLIEYKFDAKLLFKGKKVFATNTAVSPKYQKYRNIDIQPGGRFINAMDMKKNNKVIILGYHVAKDLFTKGVNPIGQTVMLGNWPFTVIGVAKQKLQFSSYLTPDDYRTWIPTFTYLSMSSQHGINDLIAVVKPNIDIKSLETKLRKYFANLKHLDPNDKGILNQIDMEQFREKTNNVMLGLQIFLGLIGATTLLIAGIGIANIMYISIKRATKEIGIQIAIGARPYHVLTHYICEAALTSFLGGAIGFFIAWGLTSIVTCFPLHSEFYTMLGKPTPIISFVVWFTVLIVLALTSLLAGFFPALKAARIDPAVALRED